ncbi:MAG: cytochrome P450, partial [Deltaproteobacteria bacterium]|nr:cytochrome P450 [Deltaproteobacteria bacterium]
AERPRPAPVVDMHEQMMALTFRIVGLTLCSTELSDKAGAMGPALTTALNFANEIVTSLTLQPPLWVPTANNRRFRAALAVLDSVVQGIIDERRRSGEEHGDLLDMLMSAMVEDESGRLEPMSDRELRDNLATLVVAGHETTANLLSWTFLLLARHLEIERRLYTEIERVCGGAAPKVEQVPELTYTGQVIDEALRLYPPAWIFEREAHAEVEIDGYSLPPGTIVAIPTWTLHRHPGFWSRPDHFDPERFSEAAKAGRPRYVYIPFGGGPRVCIGNAFALLEAKLALATLVQRFRFELIPGQDLRPDAAITLRPRAGLRMRVIARG